MKNSVVLLSFIACTFLACKSNFEEVPFNEIDPAKIAIASTLADQILTSQKSGSYFQLTLEDGTPKMVEAFTKKVQQNAYEQIKDLFGDYITLEFKQLMIPKEGDYYEIYRYKGDFSNGKEVEIRTVLDKSSKLAGFFVKPWKENI